MRISLLLVTVVLLSSCTKTVYIPVKLDLPPALNNLTEQELDKELGQCECVSDPVYIDIIETYRREKTLEGIIRSTSLP